MFGVMNMENGCHAPQIPRASTSAVPPALRATLPLLSLALGGVLCVVLLAPLTLAPVGTAAEGEGQGGSRSLGTSLPAPSLPGCLAPTSFLHGPESQLLSGGPSLAALAASWLWWPPLPSPCRPGNVRAPLALALHQPHSSNLCPW